MAAGCRQDPFLLSPVGATLRGASELRDEAHLRLFTPESAHNDCCQLAVIDQDGKILANRKVPNGTETILGVIGGLARVLPGLLHHEV